MDQRTPARGCIGCGADISDRHGNAQRCIPCAAAASAAVTAHLRPRATLCVDDDGQCSPGRLRKERCDRHYRRQKGAPKQPAERPCAACGRGFLSSDPRQRTCSVACRVWARKHPGEKRVTQGVCLMCGDTFDRGRAGVDHCTRQCAAAAAKRRSGRVTGPFYVITHCVACGERINRTRVVGVKYCSDACGIRYYNAPNRFQDRFGRTCELCGVAVPDSARINQRYCSVSCQVMSNAAMRRVRRKGLPAVKVSRANIFVRDNMMCHICGDEIEDRPTIDHIIPVSHPQCPGHVPENLAAAHLRCNISKGGRVRPEDWLLYRRLSEAAASN